MNLTCFLTQRFAQSFDSNNRRGFFQDYFIGTSVGAHVDEVIADVECSRDRGSRLTITATVFYFLCMNQIPTPLVPAPLGYQRAATGDGPPASGNDQSKLNKVHPLQLPKRRRSQT